jgi:hypothetical protein
LFPLGPGRRSKEVTGLIANYAAGREGGSVLYGTYFCAQLVADSYMHMGLLEMEGSPPNDYSPGAATPVEWDRPPGGGQPCPPDSPSTATGSAKPTSLPPVGP